MSLPINKLAIQAALEVTANHQVVDRNNLTPAESEQRVFLMVEKLAQLILDDVIRITDDTVTKWEPDDLIAKFKEHFGVNQ